MSSQADFSEVDHTADWSIRVRGATLPDLFINAATGMASLVADLSSVQTVVEHTIEVKTAMTWKSKVIFSKITAAGRGVSYGSLWHPDKPSRIATIPCGYADGYFRVMTNKAQVIINGKKYPQVGRICMDQFMVNASGDEIKTGDEVTLLGNGITPEDLADWAGTNEYEVMTNISARVPRVFV